MGHSVKADHVVTAYEAVFEVITETGFSHTTGSAGPPESGIQQNIRRIQSKMRGSVGCEQLQVENAFWWAGAPSFAHLNRLHRQTSRRGLLNTPYAALAPPYQDCNKCNGIESNLARVGV